MQEDTITIQRIDDTALSMPEGSPPDGILVCQALAGDERAFESLVDRYHNALLRYIGRYLKEKEQASDVVQFVFLQLFVALPTLATNIPIRSWLYTVARNRSLDELRRRRAERRTIHFSVLEQEATEEKLSLIESIIDPYPLPEEIVEQQDRNGPLQQALFALLPTTRSIVMLHSVGHMSFSEIARLLDISEYTVRSRYYRSLPKIRALLMKEDELLFF